MTRKKMIRIIAGKYRGRKLEVPEGDSVRPTSSRTREAVFNILSHFAERGGGNILHGASVLDVCCGSGAMAFEALSRGAKSAALIDHDRKVLTTAKKSAEKLGAGEITQFICADAFALPKANSAYDLIFIDPPYGKANLEKCLKQLASCGWMRKGSIVVLELEKQQDFHIPEDFSINMERIYGIARIVVLEAV